MGQKLYKQLDDIDAQFATLDAAQVEKLNKQVGEAAMSFFPTAAQNIVREEIIFDDPEVQKYHDMVSFLDNEYSRLMSGLAVTGYEMDAKQRWSPFAPGISQDVRNSRLQNLRKMLEHGAQITRASFPHWKTAQAVDAGFDIGGRKGWSAEEIQQGFKNP